MRKLKIVHLKLSDREKLIEVLKKRNNGKCPVLKFKSDNMVIDHIHRHSKKVCVCADNGGFVRGLIDNGVNCLLGVIENNYSRYVTKNISLPTLLRNLADYIESGAFINKGKLYSHWTENGNGDLIKALNVPFRISDFKKYEKICKQTNRKPIKYQTKLNKKIAIEFIDVGLEFSNFPIELVRKLIDEMNEEIKKF